MAGCRLKSRELVRQTFLSPPFCVCLLFFVGYIHPASFAMGQIASDRIKGRHGTADAAGKETTRHERTAAWKSQEFGMVAFDGPFLISALLIQPWYRA